METSAVCPCYYLGLAQVACRLQVGRTYIILLKPVGKLVPSLYVHCVCLAASWITERVVTVQCSRQTLSHTCVYVCALATAVLWDNYTAHYDDGRLLNCWMH